MLNVNLYDKGIIDFYLGGSVKGRREVGGVMKRRFKVEVLMRRPQRSTSFIHPSCPPL